MSGSSKLLVFEYYCAGGSGSSPGLLREAQAILEALLADFTALPRTRVLTLCGPGLGIALPPPHEVRATGASDRRSLVKALRAALREVDAALIVAPERDDILLRLTRAVESSGVRNLGSASLAVRTAADKWLTCRALSRAGLPQPCTALRPSLRRGALRRLLRALPPGVGSSGWVVKPRDGCGSLGVRALSPSCGVGGVERALRLGLAESRRGVLLQEQRLGIDASVCLLGDGRRAVPLCLNAQRVVRRTEDGGAEKLEYAGGATPLDHPLARRAFAAARRVARAIPGLRGYFGVDLILERDRVWIVDVNPRLTSSYIGLRRVAAGNPAAWILGAGLRRELPERVDLRGRVEYSFACFTSSAGTSAASI